MILAKTKSGSIVKFLNHEDLSVRLLIPIEKCYRLTLYKKKRGLFRFEHSDKDFVWPTFNIDKHKLYKKDKQVLRVMKKERIDKGKKIYQYTKTFGQYLNEWDDLKQVCKMYGGSPFQYVNAIKTGKSSMGFRWSVEKKEKLDL